MSDTHEPAVIAHENRDAVLAGALRIAADLPRQRALADPA